MKLAELNKEVEASFKAVSDNIQLARAARKLTQKEVADSCGLGLSTYQCVEKGDLTASAGAYGKVITFFGLGVTIRMLAASQFDVIGQTFRAAPKKSTSKSK